MDASNLTDELVRLFVDAQNNLKGTAFAVSTGSGQPTGIVTELAAPTEGASGLSFRLPEAPFYPLPQADCMPRRNDRDNHNLRPRPQGGSGRPQRQYPSRNRVPA
jgi:hypothetical protein